MAINLIQGTLKIIKSTQEQDWEKLGNFNNIEWGIIRSYKNVLPPFYFKVDTGATISTFKAVKKSFVDGRWQDTSTEIALPTAQLFTETKTDYDIIIYYGDDYLTTSVTPLGTWDIQLSDGAENWKSEPICVTSESAVLGEPPFFLFENGDWMLYENDNKMSVEDTY